MLFHSNTEEFLAATRSKLLQFTANPQKQCFLRVELTAAIDAGRLFVQATYKLEGDGPLAFNCFEVIGCLMAAVNMAHYPNVRVVVRDIAGSSIAVQQQLEAYATACVKSALDCYAQHLAAEIMSIPLSAFKAARLFSPHKLQEIRRGCDEIDGLSACYEE